jgi:hypothetical protein
MTTPYPTETGCCPRFVPEPWQEKELRWDHKLFVKDQVYCFLHIPLGFGKVMARNMEAISRAEAFPPHEPLVLSEHTSSWNMDLYLEVTKEVPGAEHTELTGSFLTKVFEGPFRDTAKWCGQMADWVRSKGKATKRQFMFYTTCPKCAKQYGKNYVVILAEV